MELTPLGIALVVLFVLVCVVAVVAWANWHLQLWPFNKKPPAKEATTQAMLCLKVHFTDGSSIVWEVKQTDKLRTYMDERVFRDFVRWVHGRDSDWFGVTEQDKTRRVFKRANVKRYLFYIEQRKLSSTPTF